MTAAKNDSTGMGRKVQDLGDSVNKLRKSLKHWQTLEVDYEALEEEISAVGDNIPDTTALKLSDGFEAEVLSSKDVHDILFDVTGKVRSSPKAMISRRIEYVQRNIQVIQKQLHAAKTALESLTNDDNVDKTSNNEEAMSTREIMEQLDDEDNIISSSVTNPEEKSVQLQHILDQVSQDDHISSNDHGDKTGQVDSPGHLHGTGQIKEDGATSFHDQAVTIASLENDNPANTPVVQRSGRARTTSELVPKTSPQGKSNNGTQQSSVTWLTSSRMNAKPTTPMIAPVSSKKSVSFAEGTKEEPERPTALRPNPRPKGGLPLKHQAILEQLKRAVMPLGEVNGNMKDRTQVESVRERIADVLHDVKNPGGSALSNQRPRTDTSYHFPNSAIDSEPNESSDMIPEIQMKNAKIPNNESPENASLRSQMLKYNMNQISSIVAEIDLDDAYSEGSWTSSEDEDDDDALQDAISTPDEDEDEDEHGRTTRKMVSEQYIKEMEALQKRLGAVPVMNVGPKQPNTDDLSAILAAEAAVDDNVEPTGPALIGSQPTAKNIPNGPKPHMQESPVALAPSKPPDIGKKISRFKQARSTNSSVRASPSQIFSAPPEQKNNIISSIDILEQKPPSSNPSTTSLLEAPAKGSFKPSKGTASNMPHGDVLERNAPLSSSSVMAPSTAPALNPPEEDDPSFTARQLNDEYHRLRNRMIYREGGFLQSEEEKEEEDDLYERKDGSGKKVSRFMAARLGR